MKPMTKYFGVKYKTCEEYIPLAECEESDGSTIIVPDLGSPFLCPVCGSSHEYGSDDVVRVEMDEPE
jgi:hypothetical protein